MRFIYVISRRILIIIPLVVWLTTTLYRLHVITIVIEITYISKFVFTLNLSRSSKLLYNWQSVCLGVEHSCGTCDQILLPVGMFLSEICGLVSVGCPLWREDGSAICSAITQWFESRRIRNHTLLSHLRLYKSRGLGYRIYIPQEQDGPVIPPGTGLNLARWAQYKYMRDVTATVLLWSWSHSYELS
jgi:hypothetical protein